MSERPLGSWGNAIRIRPGQKYNFAGRAITIRHDLRREDGEHLVQFTYDHAVAGEICQGPQYATVENFATMVTPYEGGAGLEAENERLREWLEEIVKLIDPDDIPVAGIHPELPFYTTKLQSAILHARAASDAICGTS